MTSWDYEHGYPGGPMVKVAGFPRPLYPPDANQHGKRPSVDGPDVVAYKRTISRAGRWPWQTFDDTYSNGFAHGKGPNVIDSGVAGVQRQQDLDDTGWVGEKTFNTLRSIRIPHGLPHAGEPAMDAYAASLVDEAFARFGGNEPPPAPSETLRERALAKAITQLGVKESPRDSNRVLYTDWYGMVGPWCAMFVTWCYETQGDSPAFVRGQRYSYVPYLLDDARNLRFGLKVSEPIPGDCVLYNWDGGEYDHIGVFEQWVGGHTFTAIEGNTSTSNDSNGGEVMRRQRDVNGQGTVFVRVGEP
jgi:hypothetical protein